MTPADLIPAETLAALPAWSDDGLRAEIEAQLQAAADAMRWDWIPPGEACDLEITIQRHWLPADDDAACRILCGMFPAWRLSVCWTREAAIIEFFPLQRRP